jgi:gamma-glutamylcyclotransferase (GGCT)/AIG2-like uncharacterized protein YtfP
MARQGGSSDYPWQQQEREDSTVEAMSVVFVYGTLKRGCSNHHWLAGAEYRGEAQLPGLALHNLGPFPMAVASSSATAPLCGELYAVSASQLALLDQLEGVPRLYRREQRQLASGAAVWVYLGSARQVKHAPLLEQGRWEAPQDGAPG